MDDKPTRDLAKRIYTTAHLTGEFTLRSGVTSHEYFDKYLFESEPALLRDIARAMVSILPKGDFLGGLEMGGIPLATVLSQQTNLPTLFVRKAAKDYGTKKLAEGQAFSGRTVVIVEDVVTSGGQIILSARDLRDRGAIITDAVCVIDRESGGSEKLQAEGIRLSSLFTMSDLLAAADP